MVENLEGATETAVIVPVPSVDAVVAPHRQALDHSAVLDDLRTAVTQAGGFPCVFSRVAWFGQEVLWLAPGPAEPFRALTEPVWRRFPECPPYGHHRSGAADRRNHERGLVAHRGRVRPG